MRELRGKAVVLIGVLYAAFVGWSIYGAIVPIETHTFRMVHLGFIFALAFFAYPVSKNAGRWSMWMDAGLAVLGVATIVYPLTRPGPVSSAAPPCRTPWTSSSASSAILLLLELSRRIVDNTFTLVVLGFLLYMLFRELLPRPALPPGV